MPQGKTHDQVALYLTIPTFAAGYIYFKDLGPAFALALTTLIWALMFSPDLDIKSSIYYRWGILKYIWLPYNKLIPHRSRFSHSFIVGPVIKLVYLILIITSLSGIVLYLLFSKEAISIIKAFDYTFLYNHYSYFIAIIIGILWGNAQHIFTDSIVSFYKKSFSKI